LAFDLTGSEIFLPLLLCAVVIASRDVALDGRGHLRQLLEASTATVMQATHHLANDLGSGWQGCETL